MGAARLLVVLQFAGITGVALLGPVPPMWVLVVLLASLMLVAWAVLAMGWTSFTVSPLPREGSNLCRRGPFRWVRHPMYLAVLIAVGAFVVGAWSMARALVAAGLAVVLVAKLRMEEKALAQRYPEYPQVMAGVSHLLPLIW